MLFRCTRKEKHTKRACKAIGKFGIDLVGSARANRDRCIDLSVSLWKEAGRWSLTSLKAALSLGEPCFSQSARRPSASLSCLRNRHSNRNNRRRKIVTRSQRDRFYRQDRDTTADGTFSRKRDRQSQTFAYCKKRNERPRQSRRSDRVALPREVSSKNGHRAAAPLSLSPSGIFNRDEQQHWPALSLRLLTVVDDSRSVW